MFTALSDLDICKFTANHLKNEVFLNSSMADLHFYKNPTFSENVNKN